MQPKQATVSLLLFISATGFSIILPPANGSLLETVKEVFSDFGKWDVKRDQYLRYTKNYPFGWPSFNCKVPTQASEPPTDAQHLSPWDFGVIGAIGDSLTAGRAAGAELIDDLGSDYRGLSFVTGGQHNLSTQATLFNIFRYFSPHLKSSSKGTSESDDPLVAGFNLAVSGSFASDLPIQAKELVNRIKSHPDVDFDNEWKFINVFIGSNDLCKVCTNKTEFGAEQFSENLLTTIRYLRDNLPLTFVNLVPPFHVEILRQTQSGNPFCVMVQNISCPCIFGSPNEDFDDIKLAFDKTLEVFNSSEFQTDTFAVVVSSGINVDQLATLGDSINLAFVALDCFHFSQMAHDIVAKILWNDLFTPVNNRTPVEWNTFKPQSWVCPPEDCPYLKTPANSENSSCPHMKKQKHKQNLTLVTPMKKINVKVDGTIPIPSLDELERRAFMEEHGLMFFIVVLAMLVLLVAACLTMIRCCRKTPRRYYPDEYTRLLDPKYKQQQQLF
ncbi:hypothetical protein V3C99_010711 [Haemonchus contortus]